MAEVPSNTNSNQHKDQEFTQDLEVKHPCVKFYPGQAGNEIRPMLLLCNCAYCGTYAHVPICRTFE